MPYEEPEIKLKTLHDAPGIKNRPSIKIKSVVQKPKIKKLQIPDNWNFRSG
jgi:hypothetical protein